MKAIAALGAVALTALLAIGGWQLGWWMQAETVNRTAQINQNSYARQNALTEAVLRQVSELEQPNLPKAQRAALIAEMCVNAAKLTGSIALPAFTQSFIAQEC